MKSKEIDSKDLTWKKIHVQNYLNRLELGITYHGGALGKSAKAKLEMQKYLPCSAASEYERDLAMREIEKIGGRCEKGKRYEKTNEDTEQSQYFYSFKIDLTRVEIEKVSSIDTKALCDTIPEKHLTDQN